MEKVFPPKRPWKQVSESAEAYNIGSQLLDGIDKYLKDNIEKLTLKDIHDIYAGLSEKQQDYRGNASGFTGFSEFLIFRCLKHTLTHIGVVLEPVRGSRTTRFKGEHGLIISQGILPTERDPADPHRNERPDILIDRNSKPFAAAEIKVVLTNTENVIKNAVVRLEDKYNNNTEEFHGVLFIFLVTEPVRVRLNKLQSEKKWLEIVTLNDTNEYILSLLINKLKLDLLKS